MMLQNRVWFIVGMIACLISGQTFHAQLIFVEGNIGAGKSTFLHMLEQHIDANIILEPCDEWQNVAGYNLLHEFYKDPKHWASLFQIYVVVTCCRKQQSNMQFNNQLQIMERSWFSDKYCFAKLLYGMEMMTELQWHVYSEIWNWCIYKSPKPLGFIYLRVEPELCYERMKQRNRGAEVGVSLDYLRKLHHCHEQMLIYKSLALEIAATPVLVLDGSLNFRDDVAVQQSFVRQILDFLKIHGNIDLTDRKYIS